MNDHQARMWLIILRCLVLGRAALAQEYATAFRQCEEGQCWCREGIGAHQGHLLATQSVVDAGFRL